MNMESKNPFFKATKTFQIPTAQQNDRYENVSVIDYNQTMTDYLSTRVLFYYFF